MNQFSKEERVAFEQMLEGFENALVLSRNIATHRVDQVMMERTGDTIWRPKPYIATSYAGRDMTGNFNPNHQLAVPASINIERSVPWVMSVTELRDALQENRLGEAARQRLASDIDGSVAHVAGYEGTLVITKATAASAYDDIAAAEAMMNRLGIAQDARYMAMSTGDYNGLAGDLAGRETLGDMSKEAYKNSRVGRVAGFELYKLDTGKRLVGNDIAGVTIDTRAAANNWYTPRATVDSGSGAQNNVDNRYQTITVSDNSDFAVGDAFTIAGVEEVHHITKEATGELKTFRVIELGAANTLVVSPPIVSTQGGTRSEEQYQNVEVTESATAAIVSLNTTTKAINPFWHKNAIEITPGRYPIPSNSGLAVMRSTTEQGIEITMCKSTDIKTLETFFRLDVRYGVTMLDPEQAGIYLFNQA